MNNPKILIVSIILAAIFLPGIALAGDVTVQLSGGLEKIGSFDNNDITYFSLSQFVELFGERISWDIIGFSAKYKAEGHRAVFYMNSPYISIDDTVKNITHPVDSRDGNLYLPAAAFIPLFDLIRPEQISWDERSKVIRVNSEWYNITDVALDSKANGLLIEIFLTEPRSYEIYISEGNWINVTIPGGTVNIRQVLSRKSNKFLRDINAFQFEGSAQVSFRLKQNIGSFTHKFQAGPPRIQISLRDTTVVPVSTTVEKVGPDDRIDRIIIDAGHGGKDYGAIGLDNTREKKIVLDIAKRLAKLIRDEKIFQAIMTREKDEYVSLEERANIANKNKGDIFVSIHANASTNRSARGFQVFFLAPAKNDEARAAAQLENAPFLAEKSEAMGDKIDDLSLIISDMIQTEFQVESADLAAMSDREFRKNLSKKTGSRGIDQAAFIVLNQVYMPSILVESAFLTNKSDEDLLNDKKYRQEVAEAIYAGLKRFKAKYENRQ
nr:N-acetylmuramoyl-L-alanine amidase [candidate division Zixibacteria bacterium]